MIASLLHRTSAVLVRSLEQHGPANTILARIFDVLPVTSVASMPLAPEAAADPADIALWEAGRLIDRINSVLADTPDADAPYAAAAFELTAAAAGLLKLHLPAGTGPLVADRDRVYLIF